MSNLTKISGWTPLFTTELGFDRGELTSCQYFSLIRKKPPGFIGSRLMFSPSTYMILLRTWMIYPWLLVLMPISPNRVILDFNIKSLTKKVGEGGPLKKEESGAVLVSNYSSGSTCTYALILINISIMNRLIPSWETGSGSIPQQPSSPMIN